MTRKAPREEVALEAEDRERREHEARDTDDGPEHGVNRDVVDEPSRPPSPGDCGDFPFNPEE